MMKDEFADLDATALAALVRRGEVQPIELVDAAIARIERVNPLINAVVTPMYEDARAAARGRLPDSPLSGVPYLLKDLGAPYAGVRMTSGSFAFRDYVPRHDSEMVARYKRAGLIIIGKTNTPEMGLPCTTESHLLGPCRNPWNPDRIAGGSSGGAAAAVAAGILPIAHASDGGGSIRIPASCCGIFGLKPTRARTPFGADKGALGSELSIQHAVTRSVRDSAALLDAVSGPAPGDPYWAPPAVRPFVQEVGADPGRLRIAFSTQSLKTEAPLDADCLHAVQEAAGLCADLGHEVEEATPKVGREIMERTHFARWTGSCAAGIDNLARTVGRAPAQADFEPLTWVVYAAGRQVSASDYIGAVAAQGEILDQMAAFFADYDVLLTPVLSRPPVAIGEFEADPANPWEAWVRIGRFSNFTQIANVTGQPAMSVPLYWNDEGLPVGVHFLGRFGDEATLLRLAAQLEAARPWAKRRPPIFA